MSLYHVTQRRGPFILSALKETITDGFSIIAFFTSTVVVLGSERENWQCSSVSSDVRNEMVANQFGRLDGINY